MLSLYDFLGAGSNNPTLALNTILATDLGKNMYPFGTPICILSLIISLYLSVDFTLFSNVSSISFLILCRTILLLVQEFLTVERSEICLIEKFAYNFDRLFMSFLRTNGSYEFYGKSQQKRTKLTKNTTTAFCR